MYRLNVDNVPRHAFFHSLATNDVDRDSWARIIHACATDGSGRLYELVFSLIGAETMHDGLAFKAGDDRTRVLQAVDADASFHTGLSGYLARDRGGLVGLQRVVTAYGAMVRHNIGIETLPIRQIVEHLQRVYDASSITPPGTAEVAGAAAAAAGAASAATTGPAFGSDAAAGGPGGSTGVGAGIASGRPQHPLDVLWYELQEMKAEQARHLAAAAERRRRLYMTVGDLDAAEAAIDYGERLLPLAAPDCCIGCHA